MEAVEYPRSLQWVGPMKCRSCRKLTLAWRSSGMSICFPHFYCNKCSNVIHREADQVAVYAGGSQELLDQIVSTLPQCSCGGQFSAGTNPKCVHCNFEFAHQDDIVKRLEDPHMIVVDGACVFGDTKKPYQVRITNK